MAIPAAARTIERLIAKEFCQGFGSFCAWALNPTIAERIDRTERQIKYGLRLLEQSGRVLRFGSSRRFRDWIETVGNPVYGITCPKGMRCPRRVLVFIRLLPPALNDPSKLYPLGIGSDVTPERDTFVPVIGTLLSQSHGHFCPSPSYMNVRNGTEEMEQRNVTDFSLTPEQEAEMDAYPGRDPEPEAAEAPPDDRGEVAPLPTPPDRHATPQRPTAPDPRREHEKAVLRREAEVRSYFDSLSDHERATLKAETLKAHPHSPRFGPTWVEGLMLGMLQSANPGRFPEIPEPIRLAKLADAPKVTPLARFEANFIGAYRTKDRARLYELAETFAKEIGDDHSKHTHRQFIDHVLSDRLKPSEYLDAHRAALGAGVLKPGALFTSTLNGKLRPELATAHEKTALGAIRQDTPESGPV